MTSKTIADIIKNNWELLNIDTYHTLAINTKKMEIFIYDNTDSSFRNNKDFLNIPSWTDLLYSKKFRKIQRTVEKKISKETKKLDIIQRIKYSLELDKIKLYYLEWLAAQKNNHFKDIIVPKETMDFLLEKEK